MKRLMEPSPVKGYQLFRYQGTRADGTSVTYPNYYIRRSATGKTVNTKTDRLAVARNRVKRLAGEQALEGRRQTPPLEDVRVGMLLDLVIEDYRTSGQKTIADVKGKIEQGLRPFFGEMLADQVNTLEIQRWVTWRSSHRLRRSATSDRAELSPASINRELSILRRAFQIGYERQPQMVEKIPPIKKLAEGSARKGFVTPEQYRALIQELPSHLRAITCVAYHVANRKGELLRLEWSDLELDGNPPVLTLWPGETKNNDGRTLPILSGEMLETLRALKTEHDDRWPKASHVFLNSKGRPLAYHMMRKDWDAACVRAGLPGLLFHDLRRSAVRNLRRAGVSETVAREISGYKTAAVFARYNITDFEDLRDAATRLEKYLRGQAAK
jgi:integrase